MKTTTAQLNYVAYTRKSTESEDRQTLSLDDQKKELNETIEGGKLHVVKKFMGKEGGESRSAHKRGRPIFAEVIELIESGKANALLVWHPNRIARNAYDGGLIITLMDEGKLLEIKTPTKTYHNNPDDKFWLALEFNMAKKSSDDNGAAVSRGLRTKLEQGWFPGYAAIGYLNTKNYEEKGRNKIIVDPQRFELVKQLWQKLLTGNYTVAELLKVAREEMKLTSRPTKRRPNEKLIGRSTLYRMFNDPAYYGWFSYKGELYKYNDEFVPMITEEEFDLAQQILGRKGKPRPKKHRFAFTGLMRCSNCGAMITAEEKIKKQKNGNVHHYVYYRCTKRKDPNCPEKTVELGELNKQIDAAIGQFTISEKFEKWAIKYLHEVRKTEARGQEAVLENKQKVAAQLTRQLDALFLKYTSPENADGQLISDEEYRTRKAQLTKEKESAESDVQAQNQQIADWLELSERTFHFARYARMWFSQGDFETRRAIFNCLGSHLWLGDQKIKVEWRKVFNIIIESLPAAEAEIDTVRTPLDTQNILTTSGLASTLVLDNPIGRAMRESNPQWWFWRPLLYHLTNRPFEQIVPVQRG